MWQVSFLQPWALWLAATAAVPLVIHLLWRQRPRDVEFTALRFIRLGKRKSFHRTRLKHLLLLLLRMGLLVLAALLIARPVVHKGQAVAAADADGTPAAVLILDDSMSMSYLSGDTTWFDTARNRALEALRRLPPEAAVAVLTTGRPAGRLDQDHEQAAHRLHGLRHGLGADPCWGALEHAGELLRDKTPGRRAIYLFTDMTQQAWSGLGSRTVDLGAGVTLYVFDCAGEDAANGAVYRLRSQGRPPLVGGELGLEVTVLASGSQMERTVEFAFDDEPLERRKVPLAAGEEARLEFSAPLLEQGHHRGRLSLLNPDGLAADDARSFTMEVAPEIGVLVVENEPSAGSQSVSHFLRLALNPWGERRTSPFRVRGASGEGLTEVALGGLDVIVLAGASHVSEPAWERLRAFVDGGGGLLVFAGPHSADSYRGHTARSVLPAAPAEVVEAPDGEPYQVRIVDGGHPFVRRFQESGAQLSRFQLVRCRRLEPDSEAEVLLSLGPGLPALVVREATGRSAIFAGPADDGWGRFASAPGYVPFVHEMMLYLSRQSVGDMQSYTVGAQVPIRYESGRFPTIVRVTAPGAQEPERLLPGATPGRLTYWKTDRPGYYRVSFEREDRRWESGFAVNTVPDESRLEKVDPERVKSAVTGGQVVFAQGPEAATEGPAGVGSYNVAPWLILLGLCLLAAESFLANRFYRA